MKSRWLIVVSLILAAFAYLAAITQFFDEDPARYGMLTIPQFWLKQQRVAVMTNLVEAETAASSFDGACRRLDLLLPKEARIYVKDMLGETNRNKCLTYHYLTYYLFPREVAVSVDQPACFGKDGFGGRPADSDQELLTNKFDVVVDTAKKGIDGRLLHDMHLNQVENPDWFLSRRDEVIAFLLPLLTALSGLGLVRLLFPGLYQKMPLLEKLTCGFGLGMMALAALTLGMKLCGFHGYFLALTLAAGGALVALGFNGRAVWSGLVNGCRQAVQSPVMMLGVLLFYLVFHIAGVLGVVESDAVGAWMLKAKILHLYTGRDIVHWFSQPRLAHAHLDYPTLVPALHAATFDSVGRLNEHVTKFWPAWMLLFVVAGVAAVDRGRKGWLHGPSFFLLALVLLPITRGFVEMEGGTLPMIFFTTIGFLQCALWQVERDRARLGLGLTLLFGGAMAKFEGFIILAVVGFWLMALPASRPSLKPAPRLWPGLLFWFLAALPFVCLRVQIPVLHYESGWVGYALHSPRVMLSNWPGLFMVIVCRWFLNNDFAAWSGQEDYFQWVGKWEGWSSLFNHPTLGLGWLSLFLTVMLWFMVPARRKFIVWLLLVLVSILVAFSGVFASFSTISSLNQVLDYTGQITAGRYLFPILVAWSSTVLTLLFAEESPAVSLDGAGSSRASAQQPQPARPKPKPAVAKK